MDLKKIVTITGKPGLFMVTGQGKNSIVVESLLEGKRFPAFMNDKMSSLEEISIFTTTEDRSLKEVFKNIHEKLGKTIDFDPKKIADKELKVKFELIVPDYDKNDVYASDMRKVFAWYKLLTEKNMLDFSEETSTGENETEIVDETK